MIKKLGKVEPIGWDGEENLVPRSKDIIEVANILAEKINEIIQVLNTNHEEEK